MEPREQYTTDTFSGFAPPVENWSKLPHELIDALPLIETIGEMKVILYVLRHTWGYQDEEKRITLDEFCDGRKRRDGSRLDNGTGLSKPTVIDGIERAVKHGFLEVETDERDKGRVKKLYRLTSSDVKNVDSCKQESLHRSEKDTPDRNLRKKEKPASDAALFYGTEEPPQREPITTNLPASAQDPIDLAAKTQAARAKEKPYTTPQHDADTWTGRPVAEWCAFIGLPYDKQSDSRKTYFASELLELAKQVEHDTPLEASEAIRKIAKDERFNWLRTAGSPKHLGFAQTFQNVLCGLEVGDDRTIRTNGGKMSREPRTAMSNDMVAQ